MRPRATGEPPRRIMFGRSTKWNTSTRATSRTGHMPNEKKEQRRRAITKTTPASGSSVGATARRTSSRSTIGRVLGKTATAELVNKVGAFLHRLKRKPGDNVNTKAKILGAHGDAGRSHIGRRQTNRQWPARPDTTRGRGFPSMQDAPLSHDIMGQSQRASAWSRLEESRPEGDQRQIEMAKSTRMCAMRGQSGHRSRHAESSLTRPRLPHHHPMAKRPTP